MRKNLVKVTVGPKGAISFTGHKCHLDYFTALARAQAACTPDAVAEWGRNFEALANNPQPVDPTDPSTWTEADDVPEVLKQPTTERLGEHLWGYLTENQVEWESLNTWADTYEGLKDVLMYELGEGVEVMLDTYGKSDPALLARIAELEAELAVLNARAQLDAEAVAKAYRNAANPLKGYTEVKPEDLAIGQPVARIVFGTATDIDTGDIYTPVQIDGYWGTSNTKPKIYRKDSTQPTDTDNA